MQGQPRRADIEFAISTKNDQELIGDSPGAEVVIIAPPGE